MEATGEHVEPAEVSADGSGAAEGDDGSTSLTVAADPLDAVRHRLDGIESTPLDERVATFDAVNAAIVDELSALDDL